MLLERRVEALIVLANWLYLDINLIADLEKPAIPTVIIGRELEASSASSVVVDDEGGGYAAVSHLYALGHRKNRLRARAKGPFEQQEPLARRAAFCPRYRTRT